MDTQRLGTIEYAEAHMLQMDFVERRIVGDIKDTILSLEHEPVVTLGKKFPNLRKLQESGQKSWEGYPLVYSERGGEATFHGPGQIVVYPILKLRQKLGPSGFIRVLEKSIINCLAEYGLCAFTKAEATGVWVKDSGSRDRKIASIGIAVRKWVTYHGLALNVDTDLHGFSVIEPCGFNPSVMINLVDLVPSGRNINMMEVESILLDKLVAEIQSARVAEEN